MTQNLDVKVINGFPVNVQGGSGGSGDDGNTLLEAI